VAGALSTLVACGGSNPPTPSGISTNTPTSTTTPTTQCLGPTITVQDSLGFKFTLCQASPVTRSIQSISGQTAPPGKHYLTFALAETNLQTDRSAPAGYLTNNCCLYLQIGTAACQTSDRSLCYGVFGPGSNGTYGDASGIAPSASITVPVGTDQPSGRDPAVDDSTSLSQLILFIGNFSQQLSLVAA
jgi:hypothetical protein